MKTNEVNKEISYETLLVTFGEGIGRLNTMFDDPQVWGVATLKQWIDGYETTRFTEIDDRTAVITSEYNMDSVKEWLQKNTPIIMVSAKKDDIDKIRGLGLGADDYMTKPFSPSELVARVKAHLARYDRLIGSAREENRIIEIRGLKIDTTARRVWVNGEEKTSPPKNLTCWHFWQLTPTTYTPKTNCSAKSGTWSP